MTLAGVNQVWLDKGDRIGRWKSKVYISGSGQVVSKSIDIENTRWCVFVVDSWSTKLRQVDTTIKRFEEV